MLYDRCAALNALARYGRSNCSQRTDDFVSGSRTAPWIFAFCRVLWLPLAVATVTASKPTSTSAATAATALRGSFFKVPPSLTENGEMRAYHESVDRSSERPGWEERPTLVRGRPRRPPPLTE